MCSRRHRRRKGHHRRVPPGDDGICSSEAVSAQSRATRCPVMCCASARSAARLPAVTNNADELKSEVVVILASLVMAQIHHGFIMVSLLARKYALPIAAAGARNQRPLGESLTANLLYVGLVKVAPAPRFEEADQPEAEDFRGDHVAALDSVVEERLMLLDDNYIEFFPPVHFFSLRHRRRFRRPRA
ncbi:hypothetical protein Dimus_027282 [Dionaea muscipula]